MVMDVIDDNCNMGTCFEDNDKNISHSIMIAQKLLCNND